MSLKKIKSGTAPEQPAKKKPKTLLEQLAFEPMQMDEAKNNYFFAPVYDPLTGEHDLGKKIGGRRVWSHIPACTRHFQETLTLVRTLMELGHSVQLENVKVIEGRSYLLIIMDRRSPIEQVYRWEEGLMRWKLVEENGKSKL